METESTFELVATHHVLTLHLGVAGNLFGGMLLAWVDEAAALYASKVADNRFVTYELDKVRFLRPCQMGDIVEIAARMVNRSRSGLEVEVKADRLVRGGESRETVLTTRAVLVAVDEGGRKTELRMRG
ncbi:MAG TPA: acyl-CoA thioesterase [Holophagaceae bacterium]|nr:acyl-CoA thioesterase [Holophagaceae bacterium]